MKPMIPYASIVVTAGAAAQALSTSAAKATGFTANGSSDTYTTEGDVSARPDYANNRLLARAPGLRQDGQTSQNTTNDYLVNLSWSGIISAAADITFQVRKNAAAVADLRWAARLTDAVKNTVTGAGILKVLASDNPGTISNFADPATTGYAGAGGAPKEMVPIELYLTAGAGTPSVTPEYANFSILRIG